MDGFDNNSTSTDKQVLEGQVRYQVIEDGQFNEGKLFKLKQGWTLRLQASSQLVHRRLRVFANVPPPNEKFVRIKFYEYAWLYPSPTSVPNDEFSRYVDIVCHLPGSFRYYFTYEETKEVDPRGGCDFLVEPHLTLPDGTRVQPNDLQIQTCLTKSLGRLDEWKSRLAVSAQTGYNCVHFMPVQALSNISKSSYSIRDHLRLMETASGTDEKYTMGDLERLVGEIYTEWGLVSMCDLVYNHMSSDAPLLHAHPDATYNMFNSPHLRPAFVLDRILYYVTRDIERGVYESQGVRAHPIENYYMDTLRHIIRSEELPKHKLSQFYEIDVGRVMNEIRRIGLAELENIENNLDEYKKKWGLTKTSRDEIENKWRQLKIVQDLRYRRLMSNVDYDLVLSILRVEFEHLNLYADLKNSAENSRLIVNIYERFLNTIQNLNEQRREAAERDLTYAVNNVMSHFHYYFLAGDGQKWERIGHPNRPIVTAYFYFPFDDADVKTDEAIAYDDDPNGRANLIQAHNGWVMGDDPLNNFASEGSHVYFKRELIAWDDSIKLRYGNKPEDSPALWAHMSAYTRDTARIFHAVRLDNCHSTPIHVAQHYLDEARLIRPDLLVMAELFTNSEFLDNKFVAELGITTLVREGMKAWNSNELGRLVHRFGGEPVGSFFQSPHRPLLETVANAILYDLTHDNQCLIKVRSVYDALASSSLVLMANCACGSTRGFDELVPQHISVVEETRNYSQWPSQVSESSGIIRGKRLMNRLHFRMTQTGFSQIYVDQFDYDTTVVTRHNPNTHESYILVARTSFNEPNENTPMNLNRPVEIPSSKVTAIEVEMYTKKLNNDEFKKSDTFINGLTNYGLEINENVQVDKSAFVGNLDYNGDRTLVHFKYFPPGAVILFKVTLNENSLNEFKVVRSRISDIMNCQIRSSNADKSSNSSEIESIVNELSADELNILLYRCSDEERSEDINSDVYELPAPTKALVYAGLQGFVNVLAHERLSNNLGHAIYDNLRQGNWMLDYIRSRCTKYATQRAEWSPHRQRLSRLADWLGRLFESLGRLPRYLIPAYFDLTITNLYDKCVERCLTIMSTHNNK